MTGSSDPSFSDPPAARGRGRPRKVDEATRRKICVLVSIGCDLAEATDLAGCSYATVRRETLRHPEFRRKLRQAMKMKVQINAERRSNRQLDQNVRELQQKLCIPPVQSVDDS